MVSSLAKGNGRRAFGRKGFATKPARPGHRRRTAFRATVIAAIAVLLVLEAWLFVLSLSKGSPSWRAGYAVGVHLGRAAVRHHAGRAPVVPPEQDCMPTRRQLDTGISTRKVVVAAHQLDVGDFREGCTAGYAVAASRR